MWRKKRNILAFIVLFINFILINSVGTAQQTDTGKRTSTWDLVRKAKTQKTDSVKKSVPMRVIHFPNERSVGELMIRGGNAGEKSTPFGYPFEQIRWERFGHARGDVKVPTGKLVHLTLFNWTWQNPANLSFLKELNPNDIYSLTLSPEWFPGGRSPDDNCMPYIGHLTGLKTLNLDGANITIRGLKYISEFGSLEQLKPPAGLDDTGMVLIGNLKSLKVLYIYGNNNVTDEGLKQLSKLKSLELLVLNSVHITDQGLEILSELPLLNHLILDGNFTNNAILYLKDIPSLKTLKIDAKRFNDQGMQNISGLTQLENLNVHWIEGITDDGISYLRDIPSLKSIDIGHAKLTDRAMLDLKQIETLEYIKLPNYGITDTGIQHISELRNLRHIGAGGSSKSPLTDKSLYFISTIHDLEELSIGGTGFSDEGMKHITKLTNLKYLSIFTANRLTNKGLAELAGLRHLTNFNLGRGTQVSVSGLKSLNNLKSLKTFRVKGIHQDGSALDISGLTELEDIIFTLHHRREGGLIISDSFKNEDLACLANLKKLRRLQITGVGIDNEGIKHLSGLTNLEFLNVICPGESIITDEALQHLKDMQKLNRLYIKDGHFTDKALDYLDNLPLLTWIELTSDYAFSNRAIREFRQKNPDVTKLNLMP